MLSRFAILISHAGQCDGGRTIDSLRGTRQITTFRNEPMTSPYKPLIAATSAVTTIEARREATPERVSHASARETRAERSPGRFPTRVAGERCTAGGTSTDSGQFRENGASCCLVVEDV